MIILDYCNELVAGYISTEKELVMFNMTSYNRLGGEELHDLFVSKGTDQQSLMEVLIEMEVVEEDKVASAYNQLKHVIGLSSELGLVGRREASFAHVIFNPFDKDREVSFPNICRKYGIHAVSNLIRLMSKMTVHHLNPFACSTAGTYPRNTATVFMTPPPLSTDTIQLMHKEIVACDTPYYEKMALRVTGTVESLHMRNALPDFLELFLRKNARDRAATFKTSIQDIRMLQATMDNLPRSQTCSILIHLAIDANGVYTTEHMYLDSRDEECRVMEYLCTFALKARGITETNYLPLMSNYPVWLAVLTYDLTQIIPD